MSDALWYSSEIDLQEIVNKQVRKVQQRIDEATLDKVAGTLAEFGYVKADGKSRWFQLFGTPERTANTLALYCFGESPDACNTCVFRDCDGSLRNSGTFVTVSNTMLEWLKDNEE